MHKILRMSFLVALLVARHAVSAFELSPDGTSFERKLASKGQATGERLLSKLADFGVRKFGKPVHEEISNRALDCDGDEDICADPDWDPVLAYILAGVRWNDDPPFRFETSFGRYSGCKPGQTVRLVVQPDCWARVFLDGKKRAKNGEILGAKVAPLLVRSHFGDMQFLHAMATSDGEAPEDTRRRVMMWSEFTWKVATKSILAGDIVARQQIPSLAEVFGTNGWSVQDLFALGNPHIRKPDYLAAVAFGSLLHVVEDSFSKAHVDREQLVKGRLCSGAANAYPAPGRITEFHSYAQQDADAHADEDARAAFSAHWSSGSPTVVDIGRVLTSFYGRQASWEEVQPYLSCVFAVTPDARKASAGNYAAK